MSHLLPLGVILILLAFLASGWWISGLLLHPPRQPITRTPADCGLDYEDVAFSSLDGLALKGWWLPAEPPPSPGDRALTVILLHPLFGNRGGYSPGRRPWLRLLRTEVDLLKLATKFHRSGYAVLMFDFRGHGESQYGLCGGGLSEDQDVAGAVEYVFKRLAPQGDEHLPGTQPVPPPPVGLVGFGLGASAAMAAIGRQKGGAETIKLFSGDQEGGMGYIEVRPSAVKQLRFLAAVQPASLGALLRGYLQGILPILSLVVFPIVDQLVQLRGGYPLESGLLLKYAREIRLPLLFLQSQADPLGGPAEVHRLYAAAPSPMPIGWLEAPSGRLQAFAWLCEHPEPILAFIRQAG